MNNEIMGKQVVFETLGTTTAGPMTFGDLTLESLRGILAKMPDCATMVRCSPAAYYLLKDKLPPSLGEVPPLLPGFSFCGLPCELDFDLFGYAAEVDYRSGKIEKFDLSKKEGIAMLPALPKNLFRIPRPQAARWILTAAEYASIDLMDMRKAGNPAAKLFAFEAAALFRGALMQIGIHVPNSIHDEDWHLELLFIRGSISLPCEKE